jgi:hypothetical protein
MSDMKGLRLVLTLVADALGIAVSVALAGPASFITSTRTWAASHGIPPAPGELVTGEHSGPANTRPGNPGTIGPPVFDAADPAATAGAAVAPGAYDYALTAGSAAGETTASIAPFVTVAAPNNSPSTQLDVTPVDTRVVVTAGNGTASVSQAAPALSAAVTRPSQAVSTHEDPAERNGSGLGAGSGGGSSASRARLSLTAVNVARTGVARLRGRFGSKLLTPKSYRVAFRVVKGEL